MADILAWILLLIFSLGIAANARRREIRHFSIVVGAFCIYNLRYMLF